MVQAGGEFMAASYVNPFNLTARYFSGNTLLIVQEYDGAIRYYNAIRKRAPDYLLTNDFRLKAMKGAESK